VDRTAIVTKDAETKVSQPSNLQELIDMETGKHWLNYILWLYFTLLKSN
jgi:hypothetical protein